MFADQFEKFKIETAELGAKYVLVDQYRGCDHDTSDDIQSPEPSISSNGNQSSGATRAKTLLLYLKWNVWKALN